MKIAVVGTGYVGLVTGTCFADSGNEVICIDKDEAKIAVLEKGKIPPMSLVYWKWCIVIHGMADWCSPRICKKVSKQVIWCSLRWVRLKVKQGRLIYPQFLRWRNLSLLLQTKPKL